MIGISEGIVGTIVGIPTAILSGSSDLKKSAIVIDTGIGIRITNITASIGINTIKAATSDVRGRFFIESLTR